MSRDDIIRIAREAGYPHVGLKWNDQELAFLERFAALVSASEREACAVLLSRMTERRRWTRAGINGEPMMPCEYAAAIRARGAA